jgi:hypothetical protein
MAMNYFPGADEPPEPERKSSDDHRHQLELARCRNTVLESDNVQLQDRLGDRDDIVKSLEFISAEVVAISSDVARLAGSVDRLGGTELQLCDVMRTLADVIKTTQTRPA